MGTTSPESAALLKFREDGTPFFQAIRSFPDSPPQNIGNPKTLSDGTPPYINFTVIPGTTTVRIGISEGKQPTPNEIAQAIAAQIYPKASQEAIDTCAQSLSERFPQFFSEGKLLKSNTNTVIDAPKECVEGLYPVYEGETGTVQNQTFWENLKSIYDTYYPLLDVTLLGVFLWLIWRWINHYRKPRFSDSSSEIQYAQQRSSASPVGIQQEESVPTAAVTSDPLVRMNPAEDEVRNIIPMRNAIEAAGTTLMSVVGELLKNDGHLASAARASKVTMAAFQQQLETVQRDVEALKKPTQNRI